MGCEHLQQSRLFDELCALLFTSLRSSHILRSSSLTRCSPISPAGFALILVGGSFALVLCGSVTFVLGCILFPWVIGFVMLLYLVGIMSSLTGIGRAILCCTVPEQSPSLPKDVSRQLFSKLPIIWAEKGISKK
ncbi:uncharacterized protein LOC110024851 [Phalaenopsis equestris]|uniref:uncharacterized protein LOC110024851 n=1 Tax=Phalaenopsis equestris TaxID=78828 RepID=UPI0009E4D20A|nr:uncharacterized protein LOC110024851 [Phalaenopsis equestris]